MTHPPKARPLALRLPQLPNSSAEREQALRTIAAAIVAKLTPTTARVLATELDEAADEIEHGTFGGDR